MEDDLLVICFDRQVCLADGQRAVSGCDAVIGVRANGHRDRIGAHVGELQGRGRQRVVYYVPVFRVCHRRR